jgi:hypothetical protein
VSLSSIALHPSMQSRYEVQQSNDDELAEVVLYINAMNIEKVIFLMQDCIWFDCSMVSVCSLCMQSHD